MYQVTWIDRKGVEQVAEFEDYDDALGYKNQIEHLFVYAEHAPRVRITEGAPQ